MSRIATNLLREQLAIARRILEPPGGPRGALAEDALRLALLTLELHRTLVAGTPFPAVWLGGSFGTRAERARGA